MGGLMSRSSLDAWRRWMLLIAFVILVALAVSFLIWPNASFTIGRPGGTVIHPLIKEMGA